MKVSFDKNLLNVVPISFVLLLYPIIGRCFVIMREARLYFRISKTILWVTILLWAKTNILHTCILRIKKYSKVRGIFFYAKIRKKYISLMEKIYFSLSIFGEEGILKKKNGVGNRLFLALQNEITSLQFCSIRTLSIWNFLLFNECLILSAL